MSGESYLSREGFDKLVQELEYLKTTKRRDISKEIAKARAHGDLKENAEYDAARNEQAMNEKKIAELEYKLSLAKIIDESKIEKDKVLIGAKVKLLDLDTEEEVEYQFVSELESDYTQNKISITSPIGKGLLGHKKDEVVEIKIPAGVLKYKILEISR